MTNNFIKGLYQSTHLEKREIDLILCHVLNINTAGLFIFNQDIPLKTQQRILYLLEKRSNGVPLAYLTGHKEFWTLDLKVNEHTLIPRPETELIIERLIQWTPKDFSGKLLDLGTGTGAIALSIATERPLAQITAVDFSWECVKVAQFNKKKYSLNNVEVYQSDWFSKIVNNQFDYIISNPPYIDEDDEHMHQLRYEPRSALTAKNKGLADLLYIIQQARFYLHENGKIMLEHGYNQHKTVQMYLKENHYVNIETHKDLAGIPRMTTAQLSSPA